MARSNVLTVIGLTVILWGTVSSPHQREAKPPCSYYASPTGGGNGREPTGPFRIERFWSLAKPGSTLCLLDGTYTGDGNMIDPNADGSKGLSGTRGNPITVRAVNDGGVTIDGQGVRRPVLLRRNKWFVIEGINAKSSSEYVVRLTGGSDNSVIRRVVAWDARDNNYPVVGVNNTSKTLLEDVAAFGIGRKTFSASQGGNLVTCRRCWGLWEGSHVIGPKMTYTLAYNNYDMTVESSIAMWSAAQMKQDYVLRGYRGEALGSRRISSVDQPYGLFSMDRMDGDKCSRAKLLGSIALLRGADRFTNTSADLVFLVGSSCITVQDTVAVIQPGFHPAVRTFDLRNVNWAGTTRLIANRLTSIGGAGVSIHAAWDQTEVNHGPTLAAVPNPWTATAGANVCYRYVDGVRTTSPLWPWPMNQRILEATRASGRTPIDVTLEVERLLGSIPSPCRN